MYFLPDTFCILLVLFFLRIENVERSLPPLQSSSNEMITSAFEAFRPNDVDDKEFGEETNTFVLKLESNEDISNLPIDC
jgi:hypothetical protein